MSTRMITIIQKDNTMKVATYGHSDGDPLSRGMGIFTLLKSVDLTTLKIQLDKVAFFSKDEEEMLRKEMGKPCSQVTIEIPPSFSYDAATIIELIDENTEQQVMLLNDIEYIDSCNYVYFINFDDNNYTIYYNTFSEKCEKCLEVLDKKYNRFEQIAEFKLDNLPTLNQYKQELENEA